MKWIFGVIFKGKQNLDSALIIIGSSYSSAINSIIYCCFFFYFRFITDFLLCSLQIGFCCVYIVFISHNLQAAFGKLDVRVWMLILLPFIIAPSLISDIRRLAYLTTAGNIIILIGLGVIYQYLIININYGKDVKELPAVTNFIDMCVSFGQIVYAFEGIAVVSVLRFFLKP